jgi:hypothetical protein
MDVDVSQILGPKVTAWLRVRAEAIEQFLASNTVDFKKPFTLCFTHGIRSVVIKDVEYTVIDGQRYFLFLIISPDIPEYVAIEGCMNKLEVWNGFPIIEAQAMVENNSSIGLEDG